MRKFNHNHEQETQLVIEVKETAKKLLALNFADPASDQQMIRHHAYLRGKFDTLSQMLEDNFPDPEPTGVE